MLLRRSLQCTEGVLHFAGGRVFPKCRHVDIILVFRPMLGSAAATPSKTFGIIIQAEFGPSAADNSPVASMYALRVINSFSCVGEWTISRRHAENYQFWGRHRMDGRLGVWAGFNLAFQNPGTWSGMTCIRRVGCRVGLSPRLFP